MNFALILMLKRGKQGSFAAINGKDEESSSLSRVFIQWIFKLFVGDGELNGSQKVNSDVFMRLAGYSRYFCIEIMKRIVYKSEW